MGKVVDVTNIIDSSMKIKSRTPKNMSINNEYLDKLQQKIEYEWKYRYNHVDIEEEQEFGTEIYTPIEVVSQSVYSDMLKKTLGDDWRRLVFKDIKYPVKLGKRYRFETTFDENAPLEEKSIWITVNNNNNIGSRSAVVRKCDSFLTFVEKSTGRIHYEPVALEDETKNINFWRDETIVLAQGEVMAIMQYNSYTKNVRINNRFFLGVVDFRDASNNWLYKVKAVRKYQGETTFDLNSIPLITLVLEKDDLGPQDDRNTRVALNSPVYYKEDFENNNSEEDNTQNNTQNDETDDVVQNNYHIEVFDKNSKDFTDYILLNETQEYMCYLFNNDEIISEPIKVECDLLATNNDIYYYDFYQNDDNIFSIYNKKMYLKDKLKITCMVNNTFYSDTPIIKEIFISLGGVS
jgi:hypothetical protein